jgi:DNA repair protein RadC
MKHFTYHIPEEKPRLVLSDDGYSDLEQQLNNLNARFQLREVELTYKKDMYFFGEITNTADVSAFIRQNILQGIEIQEHFIALFLNNANKVIGYYHHSRGTQTSTPVDIKLLTATAVRVLSRAVIVAHNHPSGNTKPSDADRAVTKRIKTALGHFDIQLLDHLIITANGYYSFAEAAEPSLSGMEYGQEFGMEGNDSPDPIEKPLREEIMRQFKRITRANAPNLYAMLSTREGYCDAEEQVIRRVLHDGLVPEAVIPLIEQEMEMV